MPCMRRTILVDGHGPNVADATIVDVSGGGDDLTVRRALLGVAIARLRHCGVQTLSAHVIEGHPVEAVLSSWGFRRREAISFVIHGKSSRTAFYDKLRAMDWHIMSGDRDT